MKNNENAIKRIYEFNKKSTIRSTTLSIRDIANKSIYVFIINCVQRFFNNFQKTTSIVITTSTIIESIKKLFLIEKINVRTYRFLKKFCRYCDENYLNFLCLILKKKTMIINVKKEEKKSYFSIKRTKYENFENFENHEYDKKTKKRLIELLIDDRDLLIINFIENNVKSHLI